MFLTTLTINLVILSLIAPLLAYQTGSVKQRSSCMRLMSNKVQKPPLTNELQDLLAEIEKTIQTASTKSGDGTIQEGVTTGAVLSKYDEILAALRTSNLEINEKNRLATEVQLLKQNQPDLEQDSSFYRDGFIPNKPIKTTIYSSVNAPVLVIHGPGPVGERVTAITKQLGINALIKYLDASQVGVITDSDLKSLLREVKAIVLAPDNKPISKTNWFGQTTLEETPPVVSPRNIKRILNAAMAEQTRSQKAVKVVLLGKACKSSKAIGSVLFGNNGENTDELESEFILDCSQRGLPYTVVKVGKIIPDNESVEELAKQGIRSRSVTSSVEEKDSSSSAQRVIPETPVILTTSAVVEYSEVTKVTLAAEGLLRAANHPYRNGSWAILTNPYVIENSAPSEVDWNDEFLKLEGPELLRIPLLSASYLQGSILLRRIARQLHEELSGEKIPGTVAVGSLRDQLVTPLRVESFSNGLRIIFTPRESKYLSSKEEKEKQAREKAIKEEQEIEKKRKSGYISPEEEKKRLKAVSIDEEYDFPSSAASSKSTASEAGKAKSEPLEGGLEVIVEESPYPRIRIKRCNMNSKTVVKEESEKLLLKLITREIQQLEREYRRLFAQG